MRIFLTGFMGSGKSYWGKKWSKVAQLFFYDLDAMIEEREGLSVDQIFSKKGEDYFRKAESDCIDTFNHIDNCIISCGGGTPCFDNNMQKMNELGCTVYLKATPKQLFDNLLPELEKRPLLKKINPAEILYFIENKLAERTSFYEQAQLTMDVKGLNEDSVLQILQHIKHQ